MLTNEHNILVGAILIIINIKKKNLNEPRLLNDSVFNLHM